MPSRTAQRAPGKLMLGYWLPVILYVALIFTISAQSNIGPPLKFPFADKVAHVLEYGGLGALIARAVMASSRGITFVRAALLAVCLGIVIGTADELFQSTVPGRQSDVFDLMADAFGLGLAQVVLRAIIRN